jgi:hypothetical protein
LPHRLPQSALHPVAFNRSTQHPANCKPHPKTLSFGTAQIKHGHVGGEVPSSLLVHSLKIGVPQQARSARKSRRLAGVRWRIGTAIRSADAHNARPTFRMQTPADSRKRTTCYSRKPGFTETRLRPLERRREMTARPLFVFMRVRNP